MNGYVTDFINSADEFRKTYAKIADDYMNYESSAEENRENFVNNNDQQTANTMSPLDADINNLTANNAKQNKDIADHLAEIEALQNGTHPAISGKEGEELAYIRDSLINDLNTRIQYAQETIASNDEKIAKAKEDKNAEVERNVDYEHQYDAAYEQAEKNYRQELVDSIKKFKESFNEVQLPDGTKLSNVTMIKNEIQKKIAEIQFNRAKAYAEMTKLPQQDPRKGDYGRQGQALTEHLNGLLAFNGALDSFLALEATAEKKYIDGNRYPDVVEMQRTAEKMAEIIKQIEGNRVSFDKEVSTVVPSEQQQTQDAPVQDAQDKKDEPVEPDKNAAPAEPDTQDKTADDKKATNDQQAKEEPAKQTAATEPKENKPDVKEENKPEEINEENRDVLTTERPGLNFVKRNVDRSQAKAVIDFRRAFNRRATLAPLLVGAGIGLISTSPVSVITLPVGAALGAIAGGNIIVTKTIHDKLQEYFLKRDIDKFASHYDAEVVFNYDSHEAFLAAPNPDKKGEFIKITSFDKLQDRLIDKMLKEGSTKEDIEKATEKYRKEFAKLSKGTDITKASLETSVTALFDRIGGITPKMSLPEQTIIQGKEYYEKVANKLRSVLIDQDKYHLTQEQINKISSDADLASEISKRSVFKGANVVQGLSYLKDKALNNRVTEFFRNRDKDIYIDEAEEEQRLENQRSEEVQKIVEEQNIDEEFAPAVPVEEEPIEVAPEESAPVDDNILDDVLYENDLTNESEELQKDDVIDIQDQLPIGTFMAESEEHTSPEQYAKWINENPNDEDFLEALQVTIDSDVNLTDEQKQDLIGKIQNVDGPAKDGGRSLM